MIQDLFTIIDKELKDMYFQRGHRLSNFLRLLFMIEILCISMLMQYGPRTLSSPATLLQWAWFPYVFIFGETADSFAGERERHTLETLLASRLSDLVILFGKLIAIVIYGCSLAGIMLLNNLLIVNNSFGQGHFIGYVPRLFGEAVLMILGVSIFTTALGILVSLRAKSVRTANQTMSLLVFLPVILGMVVLMLPRPSLDQLEFLLPLLKNKSILPGLYILLYSVDLLLLGLCIQRFRRHKLVSG
jgi:ABC-2 type transport system permease protein